MARLQAKGKATLLRVNEIGDKFGPNNDNIQAEVILQLDSEQGKAFGLNMRNDNNEPVRRGMFDLLRDGFNNNWVINIDYDIQPNKTKGEIVRVWLTKPPGNGPGVIGGGVIGGGLLGGGVFD